MKARKLLTVLKSTNLRLSALRQNLKSYWSMDESSGSRSDSQGGNILVETGTVAAQPGLISNAAQFAWNQPPYLSCSNPSDLTLGTCDFSVCVWIYPYSVNPTKDFYRNILTYTADTGGPSPRYRGFTIKVADNWECAFSIYGADTNSAIITHAPSIAQNAWNFLVFEYDSVAQKIRGINYTTNTSNETACTRNPGVMPSGTPLLIGTDGNGYQFDGLIDMPMIYVSAPGGGAILTTSQKDQLYNNRAGLAWPLNAPTGDPSQWWTAGGAQGVVWAYKPKGAASLADSYINLANPGTYNAAPGVAPSFNSASGWAFNGSNQFLDTGFVPTLQSTLIMQVSGMAWSNLWIAGANGTSYGIRPRTTGMITFMLGGNSVNPTGLSNTGNYAISPGRGIFVNGAYNTPITVGATVPTHSLYIGANNNSGTANSFSAVTVQAAALYDRPLTAYTLSALAASMAAL